MRWGLAVGLVAGLLWCGEARAGTYDVYGCLLPDGEPVPAHGWSPSTQWPGTYAYDGCASLAGLTAGLDAAATTSHATYSAWIFDAPSDTTISSYALNHTSQTAGPGTGVPSGGRNHWLFHDAPVTDFPESRYVQNACVWAMGCRGLGDPLQPLAPVNRIERSGLQIRRIIDALQCDSATVCGPTDPASVTVWASRIGLADPYPPAFSSAPSGPLVAGGGVVEGERSVMFRAEDRGGGIASVAFVVDGAKLEEQAADRTAKSCARPYTSTVPCPLAVEKTVTFDTNQIANGPHQIAVAITDAGGNRTVSAPINVKVHNPGAANGAHASRFGRLDAWFETRSTRHRDSATLPYARTRAIVGTLVDEAGAPINDAVLDVSAVAARPGASTRSLGQVATDVAGRFRYLPRAGSSRKLTIGYRAFHLDTAPSATATLNLSVRAGVALNVRPRRVSSRGRIAFSGRLRGGPGRAGTQVVIYALGGARSRIPVATVRANAKGQFHYRYRFRNSAPGVTYRFRAVMHSQASYPYATGNSRAVTVRIR